MLLVRVPFIFISYLLLLLNTDCAIISDTWVSCAVNYTALSASSAQKLLLYSPSWNSCLALATRLRPSFSYLACYATGTCEVYGTDSYFLGDVVMNATLGATLCKVVDADPPEGCLLQNGTVIPEGASVPLGPCPNSAKRLVCTDGEMVNNTNSQEATTTTASAVERVCESPFIQKSFGCVRPPVHGEEKNFCGAEEFCTALGATLISPDTAEAFNETSLYLENLTFSGVWVGARLVAPDVWRWDHSERDPGVPAPGDWGSSEPDPYTQSPCAAVLNWRDYRLAARGCGDGYSAFCELKL